MPNQKITLIYYNIRKEIQKQETFKDFENIFLKEFCIDEKKENIF